MRYKLALLILMFFLIVSCKQRTGFIDEKKKFEGRNYVELFFPDTVIINKEVKGFVKYNSSFDTITKNLFEGNDTLRMVSLYIRKNTNYVIDNKDDLLVAKKKDSFYPNKNDIKTGNPVIHFSKNFDSIGKYYLEGLIKDEVMISYKDSLRLLERSSFVSKTIYVINN
ncbi:hypothetical protein [Mangrovimonas sp. ST2L15]|uniref:hypothetical protein n=1 Tax=Mangrovimonas sp. ST2L15 TaxID=1645916 RepID=UPI0006B46E17|nr:hypothetical protein [Mangrovimonas sp. ST2L15]